MARSEVINAEDFVRTWQKSKTFDDVMNAFGGKPLTYKIRANSLRKKGVELKFFPSQRGGPRLDADALNKLAAESYVAVEGVTNGKSASKAKAKKKSKPKAKKR